MKLTIKFAAWALYALEVSSFSTVRVPATRMQSVPYASSLAMSTTDDKTETEATTPIMEMIIPLSLDEMVKQSSTAMADAYAKGVTRQTLRILLPRSADNDQLLQYYEDDAEAEMGETVLVPPDETWQGGIMQLYRAASYTCQKMLR
jgi:hypothetical protein